MILRSLVAIAALGLTFAAHADDSVAVTRPNSTQSFNEARKMLGTVPTMLTLLPDAAVPGAWAEMRDLQLGKTELSSRTKELIGVAVAAQIPCHYCSYFHAQAAQQIGHASDIDTKEAIAIAALTRHWSTFLNGLKQDEASFTKEVDRMYKAPMRQTNMPTNASGTESGSTTSAAAAAPVIVKTPDEVYREAKKMWGFVPTFIDKFPKAGIVGAWNEYGGIMMNNDTQLSEKERNLISLAVSSQVPCSYCIIMDKRGAKAAGASDAEISEAVSMASLTRHWSTVLNGNMVDENAFRRETDGIMSFVKKGSSATKSGTTSGTTQSPGDSGSQE